MDTKNTRRSKHIDFSSIPEDVWGPENPYPWVTILDQDKIWLDRYGNEHKLEEMSKSHLRNIIPYIKGGCNAMAQEIFLYQLSPLGVRGEIALRDVEDIMDRYLAWNVPIMRKVRELLDGEVSDT